MNPHENRVPMNNSNRLVSELFALTFFPIVLGSYLAGPAFSRPVLGIMIVAFGLCSAVALVAHLAGKPRVEKAAQVGRAFAALAGLLSIQFSDAYPLLL